MTSRHVALLRGVNNVGQASRVAMADLRALFESLGFHDVRTVLNSGNVVFSARAGSRRGMPARIRKGLAERIGFTSSLIVLSRDDVIAAVQDNPLGRVATNPSRLLVVVPAKATDLERLDPVLQKRWTPERIAIGRRAAYLWCAEGVGESALWPAVDRAFERTCTARNMATMTKLLALVEVPPNGDEALLD